MQLHRIHLDSRQKAVRRDLADPYALHATMCRAFCQSDEPLSPGTVLWRLEPERHVGRYAQVLVQSDRHADWQAIGISGWPSREDPAIDLNTRLQLDALATGRRFRFRLRANPTVTRNGKRLGLLREIDQEGWLVRQGQQHGFSLLPLAGFVPQDELQTRVDVRITDEGMIKGRQHNGNRISLLSVRFDGLLVVDDPVRFRAALAGGIGHGKVLGMGLLSVAPTE